MANNDKSSGSEKEGELTDEEIAKRRDEGLRRLLRTPPKPHAEVIGGKTSKKKTPGD